MSGSKGGGGANPWVVAIIVTMGAFMEVLDTTIVNVSLPHIAGSLAVSQDNASWSLTTYLVSNGIVLTVSGSLARQLGQKNYFLISIAGFTATSLACGISTNFGELLVFRALQGFFGGGLQPTQQAIILAVVPEEQRNTAFGLTAVATILAPVLGPLVGGYITDTYSWHWIFLINVPIGTLTFFGVLNQVPTSGDEEEVRRTAPRFDYVGLAFISLALGGLELGVDRAEDYDWFASGYVRTMFLLSAIGFVGGIPYLLYAKDPAVNLRVLKDRNFALSALGIAIMGFVLYASAVVIPQFAQQQLNYTATWAGLVLTPGAIVLALLIPVVGKLQGVFHVKYIIAAGGIALATALYYSSDLVPDLDFYHLALFRGTQTAALALLFAPLSSSAYSTLPKQLNNDGAALFSMARNVVGGLGISISTGLVTDHQQIRQANVVAHLTPTEQPYNVLLQQLEQGFSSLGYSMQQAMQMAPGELQQILKQQVAALAYNDLFIITATISLLLTVIGFCLQDVKTEGGGGGIE